MSFAERNLKALAITETLLKLMAAAAIMGLSSTPNVLGTWDTSIMEYFIGAGCDFDADNPMAWALCNRIRTALPLLKKYWDKFRLSLSRPISR